MGDLESVLVGGVSGRGGVGASGGRNLSHSSGNGSAGGRSVEGGGGNGSNSGGGLGGLSGGGVSVGGRGGMTVGATVGSGISKGTNNGGGHSRRSVHQPGFLKTVSIIDTLSELAHGPEVRRLAQEPQPQRTTRPPFSGTRTSSSSRPPTGANSGGGTNTSDHQEDTPTRPPGPPVLSADFQQYSEKIYDAVTSQAPEPSLRSGNGSRGHVPGLPLPRRKEKNHPRGEAPVEEPQGSSTGINQETKRAEEEANRKPRSDHRGRERGRTPDWIKRIFDIAKKGDLSSLVSIQVMCL